MLSQCELHPERARAWHLQKNMFQGMVDSDVLPLHQAVASLHEPPIDAIRALLQTFPNAINAKEATFNRMALHLAAQYARISTEIIQLLLQLAPSTAMKRDALGRLALHYACSNDGASVETVNALLKAYPQSVWTGDCNGWLPIHVTCRCGASFIVVQRLLDANPSSIVAETNKGNTIQDMLVCQRVIGKHSDFLSDTRFVKSASKRTSSIGMQKTAE